MTGWVWPLDSVQGFFESFWNSLASGISALGSQVSAGLNSLGAEIGRNIDASVNAVTGFIGQLGNAIVEGFKEAFKVLIEVLQAFWTWLVDNIFTPILNLIQGALEAAVDAIKGLARDFIGAIRDMAPHSPQGGLEAGIIALGLAAGFQVLASGAATALDAVHPFHSLEIKQLVFEAFRATGISSIGAAVVGRIFEIAIMKPMTQELNETFLRELPGPSDLVRFVVREQISPEELNLYLARQGLNPKWSAAFWGAHWVIPSREEAVELYHRGIYGLQDVTDNLTINDRRPDTIPDLLALTFRTPSRAELQTIDEVADVTEEQLKAWLRADGVSDELLPVYSALVKSRRLIRTITRGLSLVRSEVEAGRMVPTEARAILKSLRLSDEEVEAELRLAGISRDQQYRQELQAIFVEAFRKGEFTKGDLAENLLALGLGEDRVGTVTALEELRKLPKPKVSA